jgi:hypothetical protein
MESVGITHSTAAESSSGKRVHTTGQAVMLGIQEEFRIFNDAYCSSINNRGGAGADNDIKRQAWRILEAEERDLTDETMLAIMDLFKDVENADMYINFTRASLCKSWVRRELSKLGHVLPDGPTSWLLAACAMFFVPFVFNDAFVTIF